MQWTAIILAGQRPGTDPVAAHFGLEYKALVEIGGEAMLTHVLRAAHDSPQISRVIVAAQQPGAYAAAIAAGGGAQLFSSSDGISASLLALLDSDAAPLPWLVTTADHPLLTPTIIGNFLDDASAQLSIGMVERQVMLAQFPDAQRTWLRFADGAWSGTNLFAMRTDNIRSALSLWAGAEQDRKQAWKLFLHFGPLLALRAITRTIGLSAGIAKAGKAMGIEAEIIAMPDPVAAIDVDKPADHALAAQIFAQRQGL